MYTGWPERDGTEQNGTGPTRSSPLSDTFPAFAVWLHRVPGVGRNGTGRGRHGQRKQRDQRGRQHQRERTTGTHAVIFCHCFSTFIFSSSYSSSFPIISFPTTTTTGGARKERAGRTGRDILYVFVLSTLRFYSYHSSSFLITSFLVEYNERERENHRIFAKIAKTPFLAIQAHF